MLAAITINLSCNNRSPLSFLDSQWLHASILNSLTEMDPYLGAKLHTPSRYRPFTTSILPNEGSVSRVRITMIDSNDNTWVERFLNELFSTSALQIGTKSFRLLDIQMNGSSWTGICHWADFYNHQATGKEIHFELITPTAIMIKDPTGKRYASMDTHPREVFSGLHRHWLGVGGPDLNLGSDCVLAMNKSIIEKRKVKHVKFEFPEKTQVGVIGTILFDCKNIETKEFEGLCALAHFSFYSGIGYQTARGMGCCLPSFIN